MMKIYTKVGDQGNTRLVGGSETSKSDLRVAAYGEIDELNSRIGMTVCELSNLGNFGDLVHSLLRIQNRLFNIGSIVACEKPEMLVHLPALESIAITELEAKIDSMTAELPQLREFILPGGSKASSWLHLCRTGCRSAERKLVELQVSLQASPSLELIYLNRLSDFFFTAARWVNFKQIISESVWKKEL